MIRRLLSLLSLLSRGLALNLTPSAFARRRLKKTSIYLFRKPMSVEAAARCSARAGRSDNSDNRDNRWPVWMHTHRTVPVHISTSRRNEEYD